MKQTKDILKNLENRYTEIDYYNIIINTIEMNVITNADISIECCKSLIEGICKFILSKLDVNYENALVDKLEFSPLFIGKLSQHCNYLEEDFINRASSLIHLIGEIRNKRGDVSHGKLAPKEQFSNAHFSNLVMSMTDSLISYILICFSNITIQKDLEYEDNPNFNEKLDNDNPLNFLNYSRALFDQDIELYRQELLTFHDTLESEEKIA